MEIKAISGNLVELPIEAIVVNLFEGVKTPGGATGAVDQALGGVISGLIERGEIKGKLGEVSLLHTLGRIPPERVVVVGLGQRERFNLDRVRQATASALRFLRKLGVKRAASILHGAGAGGIDRQLSAQAIAEGGLLGLYAFKKHKTVDPEPGELEELLLVERDESRLPEMNEGIRLGRVLAEAANFARDLVNEPANALTPTKMAEAATELAEKYELELEVLEREKMEELGMGALLGVAQGSQQPPKFIILSYRGDRGSRDVLGLVGKGITFDSGGISIKPSEGMGEMKGDMAGGAAVLATLKALGELKPRINVTGLVPATENMPSGTALRPGDILKAMNGKTIEVVSTDAEGRLILADALCYARRLGLSPVIDVATLTGACHVALGDVCSGAFGNDQGLIAQLMELGEEMGERLWQLPLYEEYKEQNKSEVADIKNSGGRWGGAITAAQFLAEFIEDTPWVHLDIAGTAFLEKERGYFSKGATGIPVRTLVKFALALAKAKQS